MGVPFGAPGGAPDDAAAAAAAAAAFVAAANPGFCDLNNCCKRINKKMLL